MRCYLVNIHICLSGKTTQRLVGTIQMWVGPTPSFGLQVARHSVPSKAAKNHHGCGALIFPSGARIRQLLAGDAITSNREPPGSDSLSWLLAVTVALDMLALPWTFGIAANRRMEQLQDSGSPSTKPPASRPKSSGQLDPLGAGARPRLDARFELGGLLESSLTPRVLDQPLLRCLQ